MKPGPGVSVRWGAGGKGASALRRPGGPGAGRRTAREEHARSAGDPDPSLRRPGGSGQGDLGPRPYPRRPTHTRTTAGPLSQALEK